MLQPELKFRRDKIRSLMVSQGIDAALITCNANLIYTYGCVVSGYLYLPLHSPALLFFKRPNNITGEHSFSIRKPEQIVDLLKEQGLPMPTELMLEGDELPYTEYCRLAGLFPEAEVVNGTPLIRQARSVKTPVEIEMFRRSGIAHAKAYEQIPGVYRPGMTDIEFSIDCWEGQSVLLHSFDHQVLEGCWESLTLEHSRCRIRFADETVDFAGPAALLRRRIVFWDADRPETLLQENLTPEENILLPSMPRISPQGMWQKNGRRILTDESFWGQNMLREEGQKPLSKLSVLCSRWKLFHPRVLLMHNAFSASDRDGRTALLRYVNELCERNTTVILLEAADEFLRGYTDKDVAL